MESVVAVVAVVVVVVVVELSSVLERSFSEVETTRPQFNSCARSCVWYS